MLILKYLSYIVFLQVTGNEPRPAPRSLHYWGSAPVQSVIGALPGPEEAVSALSGPYAIYWGGSKDWDQRVPVPVQTQEVELQHGG